MDVFLSRSSGSAARRAALTACAVAVASAAAAQPAAPPVMGGAGTFAVLARTAVTNAGASTFGGDVGVAPGGTISGVTPAMLSAGSNRHDGDAVAAQALHDAHAAWTALAARACPPANQNPVLDGASLAPGVYCFNSDAVLAPGATLTLTGAGPWIFQVGGALTIGDGAVVSVPPVAPATCSGSRVFWQVGDQDAATPVTPVTIGAGARFVGTVVAQGGITAGAAAQVDGRLVSAGAGSPASGGSVTTATAVVNACANGRALPVAPAFKVTGGGSIPVPNPNSTDPEATGNGFANYGFNAEPGSPATGNFNYVNHVVAANRHVNGPVTDVDVLALDDDGEPATVRFSGTCDGALPGCTFSVVVEDNGEPGRDDEFGVTIAAGGQVVEARSQRVVRNGNIQFHSASLSAESDRPSLGAGQTMRVRGRLRRDRTGTPSDAYVVLQLPNGALLSWTGGGLVPGLVPLARNFVPVDWDGDILALPIPAGAPPGVYTWLSALTRTGTLELLSGISARSFAITP